MSTMIGKSQLIEHPEEQVTRPVAVRQELFDDFFRTPDEGDIDEGDIADFFEEDVIREVEEEVMLDKLTETEEIDLSLF